MFKEFEKWHGCKNDFVVIHTWTSESEMLESALIKKAASLCAKDGSGIGADGILLLSKERPDDLLATKLTIINSDGSIAKNCGNGLRVAALSARRYWLAESHSKDRLSSVEFSVEGSPFICTFAESRSKGPSGLPYVRIDMGEAQTGQNLPWGKDTLDEASKILSAAEVSFESLNAVETGNPHLVVNTPEKNLSRLKLAGEKLQSLLDGGGINVHFVTEKEATTADREKSLATTGHSTEEKWEMICFERGVGFTAACGSGACSVAATSVASGFLPEDSYAEIAMPGGSVYVKQDADTKHLFLVGPGEFVYEGKIEI